MWSDVISADGVYPRRVVLVDGRLAERVCHPDHTEVHVLSRLCELARETRGQPSYPRHTVGLLETALRTDDPGAWQALSDDIDTGDFDIGASAGVMGQGGYPATFVTRLVRAKNELHVANILKTFGCMRGVLQESTTELLGTAIGSELPDLVDTLLRHGALVKRDVRDAVYAEFGKMMDLANVPGSTLAEVLHRAVDKKQHDVLRMLLHTRVGDYVRPATFELAIERLRATPELQRHVMLGVVAKSIRENPALTEGVVPVAGVVRTCAGGGDVRAALALGIIAQFSEDDVVKGLGKMLEHVSAALIRCKTSV